MSMKSHAGKTSLITGTARVIGHEYSSQLLELDTQVILSYLDESGLNGGGLFINIVIVSNNFKLERLLHSDRNTRVWEEKGLSRRDHVLVFFSKEKSKVVQLSQGAATHTRTQDKTGEIHACFHR